ncbi:DUF2795 domain-containing protein [Mycobacterium sp. 852002-51057_SCH5723018]|uniref:DUF2795 domain-containing protein n=1 Tax=Mycobacterium sp. 852002-51057_SCH5723018 TaxID=1834094 RepID=UPI001E39AAB2|nr:DUF2795 domain-containing protein [Mycobacterium sp. 852002-51057_SCH5723018]
MTQVQKSLSGFDYPGSPQDLAHHAERQGAGSELVETLRGLKKDSFDGPSAVMQEFGARTRSAARTPEAV